MLREQLRELLGSAPEIAGVAIVGLDGIPLEMQTRGDFDANTASSYGFMLAYNQFSGSPTLRTLEQSGTSGVGGLGRSGASRLVVYETDGMANQDSLPQNGFSNGGGTNSYYQIQPGQTVNAKLEVVDPGRDMVSYAFDVR